MFSPEYRPLWLAVLLGGGLFGYMATAGGSSQEITWMDFRFKYLSQGLVGPVSVLCCPDGAVWWPGRRAGALRDGD
jgi:hypothetical protein